MEKDDVRKNKYRLGFSKRIKRKILLEVAKGKSPTDALVDNTALNLDEITKDKKYAAKLLYKWKKELYENREILFLLNHDVNREMIDEEIISSGEDCKEEINLELAAEEIKNDFLRILS